jgi:hypothetical protein
MSVSDIFVFGYARTAAYAERSEILCWRIKFTDRDILIMHMIIKRKEWQTVLKGM